MKSKTFVEKTVPAHPLRLLQRALAASFEAPVNPVLYKPVKSRERFRRITQLDEVVFPPHKAAVDSLDLLVHWHLTLPAVGTDSGTSLRA